MAVKKTFENKLERLEELAQDLALEKLDLDKAMKLYQEGMDLGAECLKKIEGIEKEVKTLIEKNKGLQTEPFNK
jgi:exodeoxyribonuclease VII small subunit